MKKSKFLQNSKDMLHRSFNPAKCKTSLKMAASRLKLLRNKKEVQVKQMRRELAQLLESGNVQTARIRVEHVIREEKMMAAYDLIEIYCELAIARMPMIESQKTCPIDLKEAVTSLVFASPRCGDVPELLDARKHFTAKYGKEFTTAAIELRPDCGVSRMLVEKLSAKAPDGQTKLKILTTIAEEHNVKWDPNSFSENDPNPPKDLLNGPSTYENKSKMDVEPLRFETPHSQSFAVDKKHSSPLNFAEQVPESSPGTQNSTSYQSSGVSSTSKSEARPPVRDEWVHEDGSAFSKQRWNMEFKDATSAAQAAAESAELASMAARAAAELSSFGRITSPYSAGSPKSDVHIPRHDRPEKSYTSQLSSENFPDNAAPVSSGHSRFQNDNLEQDRHDDFKTTAGRFSQDVYGSTNGFSQSPSLKAKTSINDTLDHNDQAVKGHSIKNSLKEAPKKDEMRRKKTDEDEVRVERQSSEIGMKKQSVHASDSANGWQEKYENFPEERLRKQPSHVSSHSHSSSDNDENVFANYEQYLSVHEADSVWQEKSENSLDERNGKQTSQISSNSHSGIFIEENTFANSEHQIFGYDGGEDASVDVGKGRFDKDASERRPMPAVFDKYDSDGEGYGFDSGPSYDKPEREVYFSSPGKKSPKHSPITEDAWSPGTSSIKLVKNSSSLFSTEKHTSTKFSDNFMHVTFDESDGADSGSDERTVKFDPEETKDSLNHQSRQKTSPPSVRSFKEERYSGPNRKKRSPLSDDMDEFDSNETKDSASFSSKHKSPQSVRSSFKEKKYSGSDREQSPLSSDDEVKSSELRGESNRGTKFNANSPKMYNSRNASANPPSAGPGKLSFESDDIHSEFSSESGKALNFGKLRGGFRHKGNNPPPFLKSRLDDQLSIKKKAEEALPEAVASPVESSRLSVPQDDKKDMREEYTDPATDTDSSGEEMSQKQALGRGRPSYISSTGNAIKKKSSFGARVSVFDSDSDLEEDIPKPTPSRKSFLQSGISRRTKVSHPKAHLNSDDSGIERKPSTSYGSGMRQESRSQTRNSDEWEIHEQHKSANIASKPINSSISRVSEHPTQPKPASKISLKSSDVKQPSGPQAKKEAVEISENPKPKMNETSSIEEDSAKRAGHVHPKLPDYDTFAAKLLSLRQNR